MPLNGLRINCYHERDWSALAGLLHEAAHVGFAGAETPNLFRQCNGEVGARRLFSEAGLALCGCYASFEECADPNALAENLRYVQSLGSRYLMCEGVGGRVGEISAYRKASGQLNEIGRICREAGIFLCYRPSEREFATLEGGTSGISVLDQETDADHVKYCVDVPTLQRAQIDPAHFINHHRERAIYFHLGEGQAPARNSATTDAAYLAAVALNPEWFVYPSLRTL